MAALAIVLAMVLLVMEQAMQQQVHQQEQQPQKVLPRLTIASSEGGVLQSLVFSRCKVPTRPVSLTAQTRL